MPSHHDVVSVSIGGVDIDLGHDSDGEDDTGWWTEELEARWHGLDHDYYAALGLEKASACRTTVFAAYHRRARLCNPETVAKSRGARARRAALLAFHMVTEGFLVLRDAHRKRVYDECGLKALRQSESYAAESMFDMDTMQVFERFYSGEDEQARDFLLTCAVSSDEEYDLHAPANGGDGGDSDGVPAVESLLHGLGGSLLGQLSLLDHSAPDRSMEPEVQDLSLFERAIF